MWLSILFCVIKFVLKKLFVWHLRNLWFTHAPRKYGFNHKGSTDSNYCVTVEGTHVIPYFIQTYDTDGCVRYVAGMWEPRNEFRIVIGMLL